MMERESHSLNRIKTKLLKFHFDDLIDSLPLLFRLRMRSGWNFDMEFN